MARIYRVQHEVTEIGPYRYGDLGGQNSSTRGLASKLTYAHVGDTRRPGPDKDGLEGMEFELDDRFGFWSLHHLYGWFEDWLPQLLANGFHIQVFDVPREKVWYGELQVVFNRNDATKLEVLDIDPTGPGTPASPQEMSLQLPARERRGNEGPGDRGQ